MPEEILVVRGYEKKIQFNYEEFLEFVNIEV